MNCLLTWFDNLIKLFHKKCQSKFQEIKLNVIINGRNMIHPNLEKLM